MQRNILIVFLFKRQELLPLFSNTVLALSKNVWEKALTFRASFPNPRLFLRHNSTPQTCSYDAEVTSLALGTILMIGRLKTKNQMLGTCCQKISPIKR